MSGCYISVDKLLIHCNFLSAPRTPLPQLLQYCPLFTCIAPTEMNRSERLCCSVSAVWSWHTTTAWNFVSTGMIAYRQTHAPCLAGHDLHEREAQSRPQPTNLSPLEGSSLSTPGGYKECKCCDDMGLLESRWHFPAVRCSPLQTQHLIRPCNSQIHILTHLPRQ